MYQVSLFDKLNFGADGVEATLQNIRFILSTVLDSCPMDRSFGIDPKVDSPINDFLKSQLTASIVENIERNLPEVTVQEVSFLEDQLQGKLIPSLKVVIADG